MRNELELIEHIEKYLNNELPSQERVAFESEINADADLKTKVEEQRKLIEGIKRHALRKNIQTAGSKYFFRKNFLKWGLGGLGAIVVLATTWAVLMSNPVSPYSANPYYLPEQNEKGEKLWADADKYLPAQVFRIDNTKDTVIESEDGIVFAIPAGCFLDKDGNPVHGNIDLVVKEAITPADIIKGGMNTMSDGKPLETGGMFYLNGTMDGDQLQVDKSKPVYASVPTDKQKPGMKLFSGERMKDGSINWTSPMEVEKELITYDITTLDFYPQRYLPGLKSLGKEIHNKQYTDSIYYSFAWNDRGKISPIPAPQTKALNEEMLKDSIVRKPGWEYLQGGDVDEKYYYGINPAKIKAIWNVDFNNTLLATKEFEERLRTIHGLCFYSAILDLYVNNLDKAMWEIDQMAADYFRNNNENIGSHFKGEFDNFAARKDGKVNVSTRQVSMLKEYYEIREKAYGEAAELVQEMQQKTLNERRDIFTKLSKEQQRGEANRVQKVFQEEFTMNLKSAYEQLGYEPTPPPTATYDFPIVNTGWNNVDKYVLESTLNRTTLDYTDPNGKKAVIKYEAWELEISNYKEMDRVLVYLIPDELSSFMRVSNKENKFSENLNELIRYKAIAVGYKEEKQFYAPIESVLPGRILKELKPGTSEEIDAFIGSMQGNGMQNDMKKEMQVMAAEMYYWSAEKKARDDYQFRTLLAQVIFPCWEGALDSVVRSSHEQ